MEHVTRYQKTDEENGKPLPPNRGTTSDDVMDLSQVVGADWGLTIWETLCIAERILTSKWYEEAVESKWDGEWREFIDDAPKF